MKKESLWKKIRTVVRIASRFARQHSSTLHAMQLTYTSMPDGGIYGATVLQIIPIGSLYQVTLTSSVGELVLARETWLAAYGWHSNGHLMEIGGDRYCIFNPLEKTVLIEDRSSSHMTTISKYTQNCHS